MRTLFAIEWIWKHRKCIAFKYAFYLQHTSVDIMLIAETHFTNKSYFNIPRYSVYQTYHPDGTAHTGIKHYELKDYKTEHIQATTIAPHEHLGPLNISAIYCLPKHNIKKDQYEHLFKYLGNRFIVGGDWNAKNIHWGSRLTTPKGRELFAAIRGNNLCHLSTRQPTYWPADKRKIPDVVDFCVIKGVNMSHLKIKSSLSLSSDHTPLILTLPSSVQETLRQPVLNTNKTD